MSYQCSICGFSTGNVLRFKIGETKDRGQICSYCEKSWPKELKGYKKMTVDEIRKKLEELHYEYPEFHPSLEIDDFIQFDDRHGIWKKLSGGTANRKTLTSLKSLLTTGDCYKYSDTLNVEEFEVGNDKKVSEISVIITMKNGGNFDKQKIVISNDSKVKRTSNTYQLYKEISESIIYAFNERLAKKENNIEGKSATNVVSVADELLKYKQLYESGLLSLEEFNEQKKRLL